MCDYMDYDKFLKEWKEFNSWDKKDDGIFGASRNDGIDVASNGDVIFLGDYKNKEEDDPVEHPSHYTNGRCEAIDVIEDAIAEAPGAKAGFLQGQVLKYAVFGSRLMLKKMQKARWYLNRLIDSL